MSTAPCERCGKKDRNHGERYCGVCRRVVLNELSSKGLIDKPYRDKNLPKADDRSAGRYNSASPWQENAIRDLEELSDDQ